MAKIALSAEFQGFSWNIRPLKNIFRTLENGHSIRHQSIPPSKCRPTLGLKGPNDPCSRARASQLAAAKHSTSCQGSCRGIRTHLHPLGVARRTAATRRARPQPGSLSLSFSTSSVRGHSGPSKKSASAVAFRRSLCLNLAFF